MLGACPTHKTTAPGSELATPHAEPKSYAPLPDLFGNQEPALANARALRYLPDTTFAAVVIRNLASVASALDAASIFREYAEFYQQSAAEFRLPAAAHILDVASWSALGVDVQAPAGAAVWAQERAVFVFFVSLDDPDLFIKSMEDSAQASGLPPAPQSQVASAQVLGFGPEAEIAFVVRDQLGFVVLADRSEDVSAAVQTLAGAHATTSLSASARVGNAFANLDFGEDLAGFVAFDNLAERIESDMRERQGGDWYSEEIGRLESSIELAKTEQRDQAAIDTLEKELEARLIEHNRYQLRRSGEARLSTEILHPLGTLAFGIDLDGHDTRMRLHLQPTSGSLPANLLTQSPGALALPARLRESPIFMLAAKASPPAAIRLFDLLMQAEGETRHSLAAAIRSKTGLELTDMLALVEGEVSMAFTFNRQALQAASDSEEAFSDALGLHLLFQLTDPEAGKRLFASATRSSALSPYVVTQDGHKVLEIPSFNHRKLRVQLAQGFLELRSVGAPDEPPHWTASESSLIASDDNSALMLIDPITLSWALFGEMSSHYSAMQMGSTSRQASAAAEARLAEIQNERHALRIQGNAIRNQHIMAGSSMVGRLLTVARAQPSGFALLGALHGQSANLGRAFQHLLETTNPRIESARVGKPSPLEELRLRIRALDEESWHLADDIP